jgi:hypothetical protein
MLKEIDYWVQISSSYQGGSPDQYGSILSNAFGGIKKADSSVSRRSSKNVDILNFNEGDTQDDQI